ncbi:FAD binding domain-containing protein [Trametes maxima]|nr:FAD binding domain-containing protein [Trametes maxima]
MTAPVLVVGAGPSGLAAALTLAKNGVPVRIVEKLPAFHTASRGSGIHSRTMEIFHLLGILEDVRRALIPLFPLQAYKLPGGTEVVKTWRIFESGGPTPDRPIVSGDKMCISQYLLEGIFRDHLAEHGIRVELATELVSLEQDRDGVTATLSKGNTTGGRIEKARVAYVIGADGAKGVTRKQIGATFEGQTKDLDGQVWADVEVEGLSSDRWHIWAEPAHFTVTMRPTHHEGSFHVGIAGINFDPVEMTDPEKFVSFIHERTGRRDLKITNFTSMSYWKPKMRMANKFSSGRVFIAGDVAHVHSPTGGQGLNTSVQDSFNLSWKIALAYKGFAQPHLLSSYDAERLPVIAIMLSTTTDLYGQMTRRQAEAEAPASGSDKKDQSTWLQWRNSALSQLEINYRWSPIVFDARGNSGRSDAELKAKAYEGYPDEDVHAGDRAPGAPALVDASGAETSLHDVFKPYLHTIIIFSPDGAGVEPEVDDIVKSTTELLPQGTFQVVILARGRVPESRDGVAVYHDKAGYAFGAYNVEEERLTTVVVRPDLYVGAYIYDTKGLSEYFARIFQIRG